MKKIVYILLPLLMAVSGVAAQGIQFFEGSFEEALAQAKTQNKKVFVDFHTSWCVYCKKMAKEAFPDEQVGAYFNRKFVCVKIDAEAPGMKAIADKYAVKAYPTLVLAESSGEEITSAEGGMTAQQLLRWAQTEMGDLLTYEQMWEQFKTDKSDEMKRRLLLGANEFIARQTTESSRDRWMLRVERLYSDYRKQKTLPELMNPEDFQILMSYHSTPAKEDEVVEYIVANYPEVKAKVGDKTDIYLFSMNSELIGQLAAKGDMDYEKYLERIKGDLKPVYDALMKNSAMDAYTCMKYLNDATYYIYNRKNVEKFLTLMDEYLNTLGDTAVAGDYSSATRTLYDALDGKLPDNATHKSIEWIGKALQTGKLEPGDQMELLIMNGDCLKMLGEPENAKKCYNQAYAVSLQFQNPGLSMQIKAMIDTLQ